MVSKSDLDKKYYILVAGSIIYQEGEDNIGAVALNALITSESKNIDMKTLGKAQQSLQMNFFRKAGDPSIKIQDVIIMNLSHLGYMTDKEFSTLPEGMTLQEKVQNIPIAPAANEE